MSAFLKQWPFSSHLRQESRRCLASCSKARWHQRLRQFAVGDVDETLAAVVHFLLSHIDWLIHVLNSRLFLSPPGVVDGRLLQGQACAGVQNHGGLHKGPELCAAPVASPLGRNWPRGLQRLALLQQTSEQHSGGRLAPTEPLTVQLSTGSSSVCVCVFVCHSRSSTISARAACCSSAAWVEPDTTTRSPTAGEAAPILTSWPMRWDCGPSTLQSPTLETSWWGLSLRADRHPYNTASKDNLDATKTVYKQIQILIFWFVCCSRTSVICAGLRKFRKSTQTIKIYSRFWQRCITLFVINHHGEQVVAR